MRNPNSAASPVFPLFFFLGNSSALAHSLHNDGRIGRDEEQNRNSNKHANASRWRWEKQLLSVPQLSAGVSGGERQRHGGREEELCTVFNVSKRTHTRLHTVCRP